MRSNPDVTIIMTYNPTEKNDDSLFDKFNETGVIPEEVWDSFKADLFIGLQRPIQFKKEWDCDWTVSGKQYQSRYLKNALLKMMER